MTQTINANSAINCRLHNSVDNYILSLLYGVNCPNECQEKTEAKSSYLASLIVANSDVCSLNNDMYCLVKEYLVQEESIACDTFEEIDPCYNNPTLNVTCAGSTLTSTKSGVLRGTVLSDDVTYSSDGFVTESSYSSPITIGDDCSYTTLTPFNLTIGDQASSNNNTIFVDLPSSSPTLQSYFDNADPLDILKFTFAYASGTYVVYNYKYKLDFTLTTTQLVLTYDTSDSTHPYNWCSTLKSTFDTDQTSYENDWTNMADHTNIVSLNIERYTTVFPTSNYSFKREVDIQESQCDDKLYVKHYTFGQGLCDELTSCDNPVPNNTYVSADHGIGDTINLFTYATSTDGNIILSTVSPNNVTSSQLVNGVLTTDLLPEGLYVFEHSLGACQGKRYIYISLSLKFKANVTGSSTSVCPEGDFDMNFEFSDGTAPYTVRYNIDGTTIKEPVMMSNGTVTENPTVDQVITVESVVDSTGRSAVLSGTLVYNITVNPTHSSTLTTTAQSYNSTTGYIDWNTVITSTDTVSNGDNLKITIRSQAGVELAFANFIIGTDTMKAPSGTSSNWTGNYENYFEDNNVLATTEIEFDKLTWAVNTSTAGVNLGENVSFTYEYNAQDVCISDSSTSNIVGIYKTPLSFRLTAGTFENQNTSCASGNYGGPQVGSYSPGHFAYFIKGVGNQNLSSFVSLNTSTWNVTNNFVYDSNSDGTGDPCESIAFRQTAPSDYASFSADDTTFFQTSYSGGLSGTVPQLFNQGTANEGYRAVYNIIADHYPSDSSYIFNTEGSLDNPYNMAQKMNVGTSSTPVQLNWTSNLSSLPAIGGFMEYYVANGAVAFIPNLSDITVTGNNTFNFDCRIATGRSYVGGPGNGLQHPFAFTATQLVNNTISYNYCRVRMETSPNSGIYDTTDFVNGDPITGGYNNGSSSGLNGVNEVVSKTFNIDGLYNIYTEASANLSDGNAYAVTNLSQVLVISF